MFESGNVERTISALHHAVQTISNNDSFDNYDSLYKEGLGFLEMAASNTNQATEEAWIVPRMYFDLITALGRICMELNVLNEVTLRLWKYALMLIHSSNEMSPSQTHEIVEMLLTYCSDGLSALRHSSGSVDTAQLASTMKVLFFFLNRLSALLCKYRSLLDDSTKEKSFQCFLSIYSSVFSLNKDHVSERSGWLDKIQKVLVDAGDFHASPLKWIDRFGGTIHKESNAESALQLTNHAFACLSNELQCSCINAEEKVDCCCKLIRISSILLCSFGIRGEGSHSGKLHDLVDNVLPLLVEYDANFTILEFLCRAACTSHQSLSRPSCSGAAYIARICMVGILGSIDSDDLEQHVLPFLASWMERCIAAAPTEGASSFELRRTTRAIITCLDYTHQWQFVKLLARRSVSEGSGEMECVREELLPLIAVAVFGNSDGNDSLSSMATSTLDYSISAIARYAGSSGTVNDNENTVDIDIGAAIDIIGSFGAICGRFSDQNLTVPAAIEQDRLKITGNALVGTTLLRWISSLSEHIRILLPEYGSGRNERTVLNAFRLKRVMSMSACVKALMSCLRVYKSVPKGVQAIVGKAAKNCMESACIVLSSAMCSSNEVHFVASELVSVTELAIQVISTSLSEKSVENVRPLFEAWSSIIFTPGNKSVDWRYITRLLSSMQYFANRLPPALSGSARSLLSGLPAAQSTAIFNALQVRSQATGTYSLQSGGAVQLSVEDRRRIAFECFDSLVACFDLFAFDLKAPTSNQKRQRDWSDQEC